MLQQCKAKQIGFKELTRELVSVKLVQRDLCCTFPPSSSPPSPVHISTAGVCRVMMHFECNLHTISLSLSSRTLFNLHLPPNPNSPTSPSSVNLLSRTFPAALSGRRGLFPASGYCQPLPAPTRSVTTPLDPLFFFFWLPRVH